MEHYDLLMNSGKKTFLPAFKGCLYTTAHSLINLYEG